MTRNTMKRTPSGALVTGSMLPVLLVMYWRLAKREEREVEAEFGEQYPRYAREVPAFVPRLNSVLRSSAQ